MLTLSVLCIAVFSAFMVFDIKRVIAYSTCSQLGYMVAGLGAGSSPASTRHQRPALRITSPPLTAAPTPPDTAPRAALSSATLPVDGSAELI